VAVAAVPAPTVSASKVIALVTVTQLNTAQAITRGPKVKLIGIATETDSAQTIGKLKRKVLTLSAETNQAIALTRRKSRLLGVVSETDLARVLIARTSLGVALESDLAMPIFVFQASTVIDFDASYEPVMAFVGSMPDDGELVGSSSPTLGFGGSEGEDQDFNGSSEPLVVIP
jgi:electron transfer flavoprotein alpha subunit